MANGYVGEIRLFAGNYTPSGFLECDGSTVNIADYVALFALIGTTYGGDGTTTFGLPNLASSVPIHFSSDYAAGTTGTASFGIANPAGKLRYIISVTAGSFPQAGQ